MSLSANKARLQAVTRDLSSQWHQTKDHWQDVKAQEFEHKYLEDLFASVDAATEVIDQLDKVIARIRSDCE